MLSLFSRSAKCAVDRVEDGPAGGEPRLVDAARQVQVLHLKTGIGRISSQAERRERRAQVARARIHVGLIGNADVRRQIVFGTELMGDHAPHAGILERRAGAITREHVVRAPLVRGLAMGHRANHRQLVGELGGLGKRLTEPFALNLARDRAHVAAVLDGSERFGIKRFLVGDPAGEEDVNHRVGFGRDRRVILEVRPGLEPQDVGQRQSTQADRADRQETSTIHGFRETAVCHRHDSFWGVFKSAASKALRI